MREGEWGIVGMFLDRCLVRCCTLHANSASTLWAILPAKHQKHINTLYLYRATEMWNFGNCSYLCWSWKSWPWLEFHGYKHQEQRFLIYLIPQSFIHNRSLSLMIKVLQFITQTQSGPPAPQSVIIEWPINQVACSVNKLTGTVFLVLGHLSQLCQCVPCLSVDDCWCCIVSLLQLQFGRHCDLGFDLGSFIIQQCCKARRAWKEEGVVFQLGTSPHSLISASSASFSVALIIVPPLEPHIFVTERQHVTLLD